ncbi:CbtA family protein [Halovenus salina]|uniref:CbtA family protein n=1 Tax=Halovenus salina TaxID=1510225 RepID=A0ABD5W3D7_9EURY|nr:CbtA family protein [Halovenus salina]
MIFDALKRGVGAGVVAGVAYGLFMAFVENPLITYMEEFGHDHGHSPAVSELTTNVVSIGSGVLWGILLGTVFGVAYYLFEPTLPGTRGWRAAVLAGAGFLTVSGVPWLGLPPATPVTEQTLAPETRLAVYAGLMVLGAVLCALSIVAFRRVRTRGTVLALGAAAAPFALGMLPVVLVPGGHTDAPDTLVTTFRSLVVMSQLGLWALIAATYTRLDRDGPAGQSVSEVSGASPATGD